MESDQLKTEISQRNELLHRIDAENQMVDKVIRNSTCTVVSCSTMMLISPVKSVLYVSLIQDRKSADKLNARLKQQLADFRVPDVSTKFNSLPQTKENVYLSLYCDIKKMDDVEHI